MDTLTQTHTIPESSQCWDLTLNEIDILVRALEIRIRESNKMYDKKVILAPDYLIDFRKSCINSEERG